MHKLNCGDYLEAAFNQLKVLGGFGKWIGVSALCGSHVFLDPEFLLVFGLLLVRTGQPPLSTYALGFDGFLAHIKRSSFYCFIRRQIIVLARLSNWLLSS